MVLLSMLTVCVPYSVHCGPAAALQAREHARENHGGMDAIQKSKSTSSQEALRRISEMHRAGFEDEGARGGDHGKRGGKDGGPQYHYLSLANGKSGAVAETFLVDPDDDEEEDDEEEDLEELDEDDF